MGWIKKIFGIGDKENVSKFDSNIMPNPCRPIASGDNIKVFGIFYHSQVL